MRVKRWNSSSHLASTPERRNGYIYLNKCFIWSSEDRPHNKSPLKSHFVTLNQIKNQINFTLYPAHSRVGRGNLVLKHSVPHFPPSSGGIAYWVAELNATLWDPESHPWAPALWLLSRKEIFTYLKIKIVSKCLP